MRWSGATKSALPSVVTCGMKSVIDFFTAPSFQEGRGSAGACAWAPASQPRLATSTIALRMRWKQGRAVCIGDLGGTDYLICRTRFVSEPIHIIEIASRPLYCESLPALTMHRNPTWLVDVSTGCAWRAAGR